jgi:hypothetical protein
MAAEEDQLLEEIAAIIAEGLERAQLQPGQNAVVLPGPITVVAPDPDTYDP